MNKYHITKSGRPALCKATKFPCPLGQHFETEQLAYQNIQLKMKQQFGLIPQEYRMSIEREYDDQLDLVKTTQFTSREHEESERTELAQLAIKKNGNINIESDIKSVLSGIHTPSAGATISLQNNNSVKIPVVGFCASPYPEFSKVYESSQELNALEIFEFIESVDPGIFEQEETYIGIWNDPETGKVYLDVSKRYFTAEDARIACENNDQIAYFDLQTFESVDVDREAKSGQ